MLTVLELFAGIGGCAEALRGLACPGQTHRVLACDISTLAVDVYRRNFAHEVMVRTLESLPDSDWDAFDADLWWMSPPCQPYTLQGCRRDLADARAAAFVSILRQLPRRRPLHLAMENVPGFVGSQSHAALLEVLSQSGYQYREHVICPTERGWPMRRRRYYLVASRGGPVREMARWDGLARTLRSVLEPAWMVGEDDGDAAGKEARWKPPFPEDRLLERHRDRLHVLDLDDPLEVARCFTSAYGRSPLRSGSYLRVIDGGLRHLTPSEILCLLGFTSEFRWPSTLSPRQAWSLAGNSLSIPVVRELIACLPGFDLLENSSA